MKINFISGGTPKSLAALKIALRLALAATSPQQPLQVGALRRLGAPDAVDAALLDMYRQGEVGCCLVTKKTGQTSLWWLSANTRQAKGRLF